MPAGEINTTCMRCSRLSVGWRHSPCFRQVVHWPVGAEAAGAALDIGIPHLQHPPGAAASGQQTWETSLRAVHQCRSPAAHTGGAVLAAAANTGGAGGGGRPVAGAGMVQRAHGGARRERLHLQLRGAGGALRRNAGEGRAVGGHAALVPHAQQRLVAETCGPAAAPTTLPHVVTPRPCQLKLGVWRSRATIRD